MSSVPDSSARRPTILLVEDNPADLRLAQEVLKEARLDHELLVARDGEQAMQILRREGSHSRARRPDLVLLDLNLPRKSGREVLQEIKATPALRRIPVLVLSTSRAESDISACYDAHANCFLTKPVEIDEFARLAVLIRDFWFGAVQLPSAGASP
jgi:two-component system, chemotaxis family, response regulator Rcp1